MRITVREDEFQPTVTVRADGILYMTLWCPRDGGYVRDVRKSPGMSGEQVSENLSWMGAMLWCPRRERLAGLVRKVVRRKATRENIAWNIEASAFLAARDVETE